MSASDFGQVESVQEDAPEQPSLPPTSFPNLLSFLLALLGPWGIAAAVGAVVLVLLSVGLNAAWEASPRLPANPPIDVSPPPIEKPIGSDTAQPPLIIPREPSGEKLK
ncbi:hypothetical protein [Mesorhizobium sp. M1322]|uniref:hypothetical protein n=1 Tax=Mesorhizobium sp. M1322 TaxID=2957081 RepID=UPI0033387FD5